MSIAVCKNEEKRWNMEQYGYIQIKLKDLIEEKGVTKNTLCRKAELQRTQLNRFCKSEITRLDTSVLARICTVLNCDVHELLEFVPADKND